MTFEPCCNIDRIRALFRITMAWADLHLLDIGSREPLLRVCGDFFFTLWYYYVVHLPT